MPAYTSNRLRGRTIEMDFKAEGRSSDPTFRAINCSFLASFSLNLKLRDFLPGSGAEEP